MCMLTVFTISLFVDVLADYDNPLHGFFRIQLTGYEEVIDEMERIYTDAVKANAPSSISMQVTNGNTNGQSILYNSPQ